MGDSRQPLTRRPSVDLMLSDDMSPKIHDRIDAMMLSDNQIQRVMDILYTEMIQGLSQQPEQQAKSSLKMENTYLRSLIDGTEHGDYLALDLGGTNLRVLLVTLRSGACHSISQHYSIPPETLHGPAEGVFDHIADSIYMFMTEHNLMHQRLALGFTFSFPMIHQSINKGILVTWTKSFTCPNGRGEDVVQMLEDALHRHGDVPVDVVAVLNDTTGTLMAGSYLDKQCEIGLIMGTGCNAAYLEDLDNVPKWDGDENTEDESDSKQKVVINVEWGAFGDNGSLDFIKTKYDYLVDGISNHRGTYTFEKLVAAHYVGDLVRIMLLDLANEGLLFDGHVSDILRLRKSVSAGHVTAIERDTEEDTSHTCQLLADLQIPDDLYTTGDISIIRYLCSAVSIRTAQLISAGVSVLVNHMAKTEMTVAIDGSYYRFHPKLHDMMTAWCAQLAPLTQTQFISARDGSGRGAGLVAAVAVRSRTDTNHDVISSETLQ